MVFLASSAVVMDYDVCATLFNFSQLLLVGLNATSECCLWNSTSCAQNTTGEEEDMDMAKGEGKSYCSHMT